MEINKPISAVVIFIITLVLTFLFVVPEYQKLKGLQNDVTKKQVEYNNIFIYYTEVSDTIKNIESKKDALPKIDNALPPNFSYAPLIYFFQKKVSEIGLVLGSISFLQVPLTTSDQAIKSIVFSIDVVGSYDGFKNFLSSLDKSARLFQINSISFAPTGSAKNISNQQNPTYDFKLELQTNTY